MDFYIIKATYFDYGVYYQGYPYTKFQKDIDLAMRFKSKKSAYAVISKKKNYFKQFSNVRLIHYVAEEKDFEMINLE